MIKIEQIVKPFNSGFSAVSIKYLLENLQKRYYKFNKKYHHKGYCKTNIVNNKRNLYRIL